MLRAFKICCFCSLFVPEIISGSFVYIWKIPICSYWLFLSLLNLLDLEIKTVHFSFSFYNSVYAVSYLFMSKICLLCFPLPPLWFQLRFKASVTEFWFRVFSILDLTFLSHNLFLGSVHWLWYSVVSLETASVKLLSFLCLVLSWFSELVNEPVHKAFNFASAKFIS